MDAVALAEALGSSKAALSILALRLAEEAGWIPRGRCASIESAGELAAEARALRIRTGGALPPHPLPSRLRSDAWREALRVEPVPLSAAAEALLAREMGRARRRAAGVYFTPPDLAAAVVELGLLRGGVGRGELPRVFDPCAGAGAFLEAAALALAPRCSRVAAALLCGGADLSADALAAARAALALVAGPQARAADLAALRFDQLDSLWSSSEPADLIVSNPPYGHVDDPRLAARWPALRGGEIDRYAAFILRSLELARPGGTVALLVPDTWMWKSRGAPLRRAILDSADIAALVDLGKPFAAAKDTRVQALVMVRRRTRRTTFVGRREGGRVAPLAPARLRGSEGQGWQPYRTRGEADLCAAMEAASVPLGALCSVGYGLRTGRNALHVAPGPGRVGLLGGEDIVPFALRWRPKHLIDGSPRLEALAKRQLGRPRIAVQRIRTNSGAPHARWLEAAVAPPELVCLDSLSTLASPDEDRLWALLALLCSSPVNRYHRLRTTDVNVKPALLARLPAPRRLAEDGGARELAALARARALEASVEPQRRNAPAPALERAIDAAVYDLYGLDPALIDVAERGHWGPRFAEERARLPG